MDNPKYRRVFNVHADETHRLAMQAKETVFLAQDAAVRLQLPDIAPAQLNRVMPDWRKRKKIYARVHIELGRARAALEALDRAMLDAMSLDNDHCNCGGYPDGLPHEPTCPLWYGHDGNHR